MLRFLKEYKFILSLIVLLGIMGILARWDESKTKREQRVEDSKNKVFNFGSSDVVSIDYVNESESIKQFTLSLEEKQDPKWILSTADIQEVADQGMVKSFVDTVVSLSFKEKFGLIEDSSKLKAYGISDSKIRFKISLKDTSDVSVVVGGTPSVGSGAYLKINNEVYICEEFVRHGFTKSITTFREKKVIAVDPVSVVEISFLYPNSTFEIEKKDNVYKMKNTDKVLDKKLVESFIRQLNSTLVSSFIDHPDSKLLGSIKSSKFLDLFITDDKQVETKMEFSYFGGSVYFRFSGKDLVYVANADLKNTLTKQEKDFIKNREQSSNTKEEEETK